MTDLRDVIETASSEINRLRHPDTSEAVRRLDEILIAGKLGQIGNDRVEGLTFYDGELRIDTSYSVRGCSQSGDYRIPEAIIDAPDPVAAMRVWAQEQRIIEARGEVEAAERVLACAQEKLARVEAEA